MASRHAALGCATCARTRQRLHPSLIFSGYAVPRRGTCGMRQLVVEDEHKLAAVLRTIGGGTHHSGAADPVVRGAAGGHPAGLQRGAVRQSGRTSGRRGRPRAPGGDPAPQSAVGRGTTMTGRLPTAPRPAPAAHAGAPPHVTALTAPAPRGEDPLSQRGHRPLSVTGWCRSPTATLSSTRRDGPRWTTSTRKRRRPGSPEGGNL